MKILFFGTPQLAVPFLEFLHSREQVVGVVCRPDEPVGRGYEIKAPPTKVFAQSHGLPVFQPAGPWQPETIAQLKDRSADVGIAVAYGRIVPEPVYKAPRLGSLNIHFSLLPKYRGAAPMQWSLINGETKTGVTAFWLDAGMDTGPVAHQAEIPVLPDDDVVSLRTKLIPLGIEVLSHVLDDLSRNVVIRRPQEGTPVMAPQLKKEHGRIQWTDSSSKIVNLIRGVCEWPGAVTFFQRKGQPPKQLKILKASPAEESAGISAKPGQIVSAAGGQGLFVQAGNGAVLLREVQPEGKKPMSAWAFWQGAQMRIGDRLG